jgi:adenylate kinase
VAAVSADPNRAGLLPESCRAVILLGPPGSGKGTQAQRIAQRYRLPHLSTGDMFRDNIRRDTELGRKAKPIMARGDLVPDEIVLSMVEDRIGHPDCDKGFILDGFPRTLAQAEELGRILQRLKFGSTVVLDLVVQMDLLMRRLTGRRICKTGGHIYNIFDRPPKQAGICDEDGSELIQRTDDTEAVIRERLVAYEEQTRPLVEFYRERGLLTAVDGNAGADRVTASIMKILDGAEASE